MKKKNKMDLRDDIGMAPAIRDEEKNITDLPDEEKEHYGPAWWRKDQYGPAWWYRHGPRPPQYLQLHWSALHARDAQRHAPVVDLVIAEILLAAQELFHYCFGYLLHMLIYKIFFQFNIIVIKITI